jgi:predicted  nucleic acid-binding Zn-ribbon protein
VPLSDYLKGPQHKARSEKLEVELSATRSRCAEAAAHLSALQVRYDELQALATRYGAMEVADVQREISAERQKLQAVKDAVSHADQEAASVADQVRTLRDQVLVLEETLLLESFALYLPKFKLASTTEYRLRLDETRAKQKEMIKGGTAATGNMNWEVNGKKSGGKKLVSDMMKLVIRSFNNECDFCVDNVKFDNVEVGEKRIRQSWGACNKLGRVMTVELSSRYLDLKLDELHLAHEFQIKRQEEKEEAKRIREELREQQKLEQEIRAAREKITKERKHFSAALKDLQARLGRSTSEDDRAALKLKIEEVEAGKAALDGEEKLIDYREGNAKAGYVYVISNLGAFGEGVYKIGMTRRLDPMERIDELGDASVPFWFDVHAMVFSDNAPALEAKLHERFAPGRLNKVNGRKEFFRAGIEEIEAVIRQHYDPVVEVVREAAAEQYRESLRMALPSIAIQQAERAAAASVRGPSEV